MGTLWSVDRKSDGPVVLLAEDDPSVRKAVVKVLELENYTVRAVVDGAAALEAIGDAGIDVAVLDVAMPFADGLTVCREARHRGVATPILMLTARDQVGDRVAGLDAGADDYLVKPFAVDELLARLRALLRRANPGDSTELRVADMVLDPATRTARRGTREMRLTKTEFDLLELLMRGSGVVHTRERIYEDIWGYDFETGSKSLDVYIGYLRRKTEEGGEERLVHTVRGVGYVVRPS